ncbi:(deoxy)nucleoside triphosphate pyrophosphohydrolase [Myxococcota bacterium]|nr:(deoxy)nucleoside triphosphate pyrophosphohydrolase [Myxococcota bacterium]MBU1431456.1 (deoxy)nucleoside triphosphate pyrophosphohydrolase [Myxococcota bacterium]MBU1898552.1 (deoxy)nucleoside triphosphate pyrophosphohydrolase [Myxococcota bacterium]
MSEKKSIRVVAAEIEQGGRFLITQRRPTAILPLLWEFPSGRVEEGESDEEALARELFERMGVEVEIGKLSMFIKHEYEDYCLDFCVYRCELRSETILKKHINDFRWVRPHEMEHYEFPPADFQTITRLLDER